MNRIIILSAVFLLLSVSVYGQIQDSLIIDSVHVDYEVGGAWVSIYVVTFDSVSCFGLPLQIIDQDGSARFLGVTMYFPPVNAWEILSDSVFNDHQMTVMGWRSFVDPNPPPPIYTNGQRQLFMTFSVLVDFDGMTQTAYIDSFRTIFLCGDSAYSPVNFQRGIITIDRTGVKDLPVPDAVELSQNYPNPFNPTTEIEFSVSRSEQTRFDIYDLQGREIINLLYQKLEPGRYKVRWDGKNTAGLDVPSGIYFYRLTSGNFNETKLMTLIR